MRSNARGLVLLLALATEACLEDDPGDPLIRNDSLPTSQGRTRVYLTDSPFPFDAVQRVEVYIERIAASVSADTAGDVTAGWVTVAEPRSRFDLLQLQRGTTAFLGDGELPAGAYRAVRMVVNTDSSSLTYNDGTLADVQWQVAGPFQLNALVEAPIDVPDSGTQIVIDFDVGRSFVRVNDRFVFIPWFRAVNESATGSVMGRVTWERGPSAEPVQDAAVGVYRGDSLLPPNTWSLAATGRTDSAGIYEIHFVLGGDYIVRGFPPESLFLGTATTFGVRVTPRDTARVDLILPPGIAGPALYITGDVFTAIGDSAILFATVYDADGDTVPNPAVVWDNLNPQVAGMNASGAVAAVAGLSEGVASIIARSGEVADTADVTVVADTSLVVADGVVSFIALEGGFHAIRAVDGTIYDPINLPSAMAVDGLRVRFAARIRRDLAGFHMVGPLIELLRIERR